MPTFSQSLSFVVAVFFLALNGTNARAQQSVVSPTLASSTFLGGNGSDEIDAMATDSAGNIYVFGTTSSTNLPATANAFQKSAPGGFSDCFVAKLNPTANSILYLTYLGGSDTDTAGGIAVDSSGNAYVAGTTLSRDFPITAGAAETRFAGANVLGDAFIVKLDPTGSALIYSTYLGGGSDDLAASIALDVTGAAYIAGSTRSRDFPITAGALQSAYGGHPGNVSGAGGDAFVAKLNPAGTQFEFVTYLGGAGEDSASSITLDASGNPVVAGMTASSDFPVTPGVFQTHYAGNSSDLSTEGDAFVAKLNPLGTALQLSTFLGGSSMDGATRVECDSAGNLYLQGSTFSTDFPTAHALQSSAGGKGDAFLAKFNPTASTLLYSTYFGGNDLDTGSGTIDAQGNLYLSGFTRSTNFPALNGFQPYLGDTDTYLAKIDPSGTTLVYSTFFGGSNSDFGGAILRDSSGVLWLAGSTFSQDFPVRSALETEFGGGTSDAFLVRITESTGPPPESNADLEVTLTSDQATLHNGTVAHFTIAVTNQGPAPAEEVQVTQALPLPLTFTSATPAQGTCTAVASVVCSLGALSPNQTTTITVVAAVPNKSGQLAGSLVVTAGAFSSTTDPDMANNSSQVTLTLSTPGNAGGGASGSGCFIATAAYGSYLDPHVQVLRDFRDRHLLTNGPGRSFVRMYYRCSPPAAAFIAQSAFARRAVRCMLAPLIFVIEYPAAILCLILICALVLTLYGRSHTRNTGFLCRSD